jgi:hypothetical protein
MPARAGRLAVLGIAGGVAWLALPLFSPETGAVRLSEEAFNRLWSPALAAMGAGYLGLREGWPTPGAARTALGVVIAGMAVMVAGNIAEYWFLVGLRHGDPIRDAAWMAVLAGLAVVLLGSLVAGIGARREWRTGGVAWWGLVLLAPATVAIGLMSSGLIGIPLGVSSIASGVSLVSRRPARQPRPRAGPPRPCRR